MLIGDTPAQLGQIEAADAMMIDGKIVTRDDYLALAATVEALRKSASDAYTQWNYSNDVYGAMQHLIKAVIATPQQHLAEIRAQAIQDFIQFMYSQDNCQLCNSSLDIASKYAESIRQENRL